MVSRTNTPIWRTAKTLNIMFWVGVALAPLSAMVLLVGNSDAVIKFALILGLGCVVLIGLSVTWRRDASSVEKDLVMAIADVESNTKHAISDLRTQVRQSISEPAPQSRGEMSAPRPFREVPARTIDSDQMPMQRDGRQVSPPRQSVDYDDLPSTDPMERQERRQPQPGYNAQSARAYGREDETPRPRHHQQGYGSDADTRFRPPEPEGEPGVYRGRGGKTPLTEKISSMRKTGTKRDESGAFDARREADSLLSGLHGDDTRHRDEPPIARQRAHADDGYDARRGSGEYSPRRRAHAEPDTSSGSSAWRGDERSDAYRTRGASDGVANGWSDGADAQSRAASWSMEPPRRGRHYEPDETRAISRHEAEAMPRWSEYESPSRSRSASYMDEYYGRR